MAYEIKIEQFEGPLDLLLTLISKREVDIYDISLAGITNEYLSYIEQLRELNLEVTSEFLLIAATLFEIKSRGLLSEGEIEPDESLSGEEVRKELIKKLIAYKKFKNVAQFFASSLNEGGKYYRREAELEACFVKLVPDFKGDIKAEELARHLLHLVRMRHIIKVNTEHITPLPLSVEEQVDYVIGEIKEGQKDFREITKGFDRNEVIVTFLALLELCKRSMVDLKQTANFGELEIELLEEKIGARRRQI